LGWGKTEYEEESVWTVTEVKLKPFGVTFCKGANSPIPNDNYFVLED
jgi:hypothetical protein